VRGTSQYHNRIHLPTETHTHPRGSGIGFAQRKKERESQTESCGRREGKRELDEVREGLKQITNEMIDREMCV
jgi:hypothetical protein